MIKISCEFPDPTGHEGVVEGGPEGAIGNLVDLVQGTVMSCMALSGGPFAKIHVENIPPSIAAELADIVEEQCRDYLDDDQHIQLTIRLNPQTLN